MANSVFTKTLGLLLSCSPTGQPPARAGVVGLFISRSRTLHFPLLNFLRFSPFLYLSGSLCMTERHNPCVQLLLPAQGHLQTCPSIQVIHKGEWEWTQH